ncbi:MAG TPA: hypothetical protein VH643_35375 [Gemmataceae bacterium]|jgi:hypothetical protein
MHSNHDDSGTWTFSYDGEGHLIAPDVIVGDAYASAPTDTVLAVGTCLYPPAAAASNDPFDFTPGHCEPALRSLLSSRRCPYCQHPIPGRWLSEDPSGLLDSDLNLYR